jgi:hypothetical protein
MISSNSKQILSDCIKRPEADNKHSLMLHHLSPVALHPAFKCPQDCATMAPGTSLEGSLVRLPFLKIQRSALSRTSDGARSAASS